MKILLLGGGLQGLSCGESLRQHHTVDVVSEELQIRRSKFFRQVYSKGYKSSDNSALDVLRKEKYDVIIPMGDRNVSYLSCNKERIETEFGCKCACPSADKLSVVEDKHHFMQFCQDNNVPHPQTATLNKDNIEECAQTVGFPSLIKPDYSVGARGITRVNTIDELKEKYPVIKKQYGECTLQELIDNKEYYYNVMLYRSKEGGILAHAIIKIVRMYPIGAGSSTCCQTIENDALLNVCTDCLEKLNWEGMADFDVLQRLDNGDYKIIEINPRVPASLRAAQISGVNFPEVIVNDVLGKVVPQYHYEPGMTLRYMGTDLMWFMKSDKRFKSTPCWFKFTGRNIYYQDIFSNDITTWWTWLAEGFQKISRRNKKLR